MTESDSQPSPGVRITASLKWFDPDRGFGFLAPDDGSRDVFCHVSVLERAGRDTLPLGATVSCEVIEGPRGPQVSCIHAVDAAGASPDRSPRGRPREPQPGHDEPSVATEEVAGSVKFFNAARGYGFVIPDGGGQDVFIRAAILARSGLHDLAPLQRVRVRITQGRRGPQATHIEILRDGAASR